eukprot:162220_1
MAFNQIYICAWVFSFCVMVSDSSSVPDSVTNLSLSFSDTYRCTPANLCTGLEYSLKFGRIVHTTVYFQNFTSESQTNGNEVTQVPVVIAVHGAEVDMSLFAHNLASEGFLVVESTLPSATRPNDLGRDALFLGTEIHAEASHSDSVLFNRTISNQTFYIAHGDAADGLLSVIGTEFEADARNNGNPISGMIIISPSTSSTARALTGARLASHTSPTLVLGGALDCRRPTRAHALQVYRALHEVVGRSGAVDGQCKVFVEVAGGVHCHLVDNRTDSVCTRQESVCRHFQTSSVASVNTQFNITLELTTQWLTFLASGAQNMSA